MLIATLEDVTGTLELVVFPKTYPLVQAKFVEDDIVLVKGRLKFRERRGAEEDAPLEINVAVNEINPFDRRATAARISAWHVRVAKHEQIDALAELMDAAPGPTPIVMHAGGLDQPLPRRLSNEASVRTRLEQIFGSENVRTE